MKKNIFALLLLFGIGIGACTSNQQKEQVNDESKEIDVQSQDLDEDIDENDPDELGKSSQETDTSKIDN